MARTGFLRLVHRHIVHIRPGVIVLVRRMIHEPDLNRLPLVAAQIVGETLAKQALSVGIKCVCFDRNRYKFHGRVKALADAARKAGLVF